LEKIAEKTLKIEEKKAELAKQENQRMEKRAALQQQINMQQSGLAAVRGERTKFTLQELAEGRLLLGVGIGWMLSEFKALGLDMRKRASESEAVLDFLNKAFSQDVVDARTLILVLSGITMVTGVLGAAAQNEFRRILSFHSVSQVGYMLMGLGLSTPLALGGSLFFLLHHGIVKSNLFLF